MVIKYAFYHQIWILKHWSLKQAVLHHGTFAKLSGHGYRIEELKICCRRKDILAGDDVILCERKQMTH